jgi:hypothetical protein
MVIFFPKGTIIENFFLVSGISYAGWTARPVMRTVGKEWEKKKVFI